MLTIGILYSNDRHFQLNQCLSCLKDMELYENSQKILIVDESLNSNQFYDFDDIINVPRQSQYYCWADAWNALVSNSVNDKIIYLDSDRILPKNYFSSIYEKINNNTFVFPKFLYSFPKTTNIDIIKQFRDNKKNISELIPDHRIFDNPANSIRRKNPMSGCVAFTKKGYHNSGGVDPEFIGWGYPDTDYFMKTYQMGYEFNAIEVNELHLSHDYADGGEKTHNRRTMKLMGLWNGVKFCKKWNLELHQSIIYAANEMKINISKVGNQTIEQFINKYNNIKLL